MKGWTEVGREPEEAKSRYPGGNFPGEATPRCADRIDFVVFYIIFHAFLFIFPPFKAP